ncbi:YheC/YheD family protein [Bacillus sp. 31A1R]|uniref:YheC/YheD family protein n=1 Tax=Robertmurraya mangrovi TaxID=3098077 RepID=A0ABU5ISN9_9BACI|nr:YheC/YheD family protein [Bacillus sp. 31A1R]MDZ5470177.1 YheC/YheD family protein [Bacillus sp. 31A1R]
MMVFYDLKNKCWFQTSLKKEELFFGKSAEPLSFLHKEENPSLPFKLNAKDKNLGPVVGIMTTKDKNGEVAGNAPYFKELQSALMKLGGMAIVFTLEDLTAVDMLGYIYLPEQKQWLKATCPLPHVVYNRIPFRKKEESITYENALEIFSKNGIPIFNPSFIDKYKLHQLLSSHDYLSTLLPETILIDQEKELLTFLKNYKSIYIKPVKASKGKGIYRVNLDEGGCLQLDGIRHSYTFTNFEEFWNNRDFILKNRSYIAQKAIQPALYSGQRYDFRILSHYKGRYEVTGVGIRQSSEQNITTHIPNGGKLLTFEEVKTDRHMAEFENMVQECGALLSEKLGFFGELSIDAGLTESGEYVIYEVNSKPMSFDEEEIEIERIQSLVDLFFQLAQFQ